MGEQLGERRLRENIDPEVKRHPNGSVTESAVYIDSETGEMVESVKHCNLEGGLEHRAETRTDLESGEETSCLSLLYWPGDVVAHKDHTFIDRKTAESVELVEDFYPAGSRREAAETRHKPPSDRADGEYWLRTWDPEGTLLREQRIHFDAEANQEITLEKENFPDGQLKSVSEVCVDHETGSMVKTLIENYWQNKRSSAKEESFNPETGKTVGIGQEYRPDGSLRLEFGEWTAHNDHELVEWTHHYSEAEVLTHGITIRFDLETGERQVLLDDYTRAIATQTTEQLAGLGNTDSDQHHL